MEEIKINDYIEGYEYYGHTVKRIQGWVDSVDFSEGEGYHYNIQADDRWNGARGTIIFDFLGKVKKLKHKPRP